MGRGCGDVDLAEGDGGEGGESEADKEEETDEDWIFGFVLGGDGFLREIAAGEGASRNFSVFSFFGGWMEP